MYLRLYRRREVKVIKFIFWFYVRGCFYVILGLFGFGVGEGVGVGGNWIVREFFEFYR